MGCLRTLTPSPVRRHSGHSTSAFSRVCNEVSEAGGVPETSPSSVAVILCHKRIVCLQRWQRVCGMPGARPDRQLVPVAAASLSQWPRAETYRALSQEVHETGRSLWKERMGASSFVSPVLVNLCRSFDPPREINWSLLKTESMFWNKCPEQE